MLLRILFLAIQLINGSGAIHLGPSEALAETRRTDATPDVSRVATGEPSTFGMPDSIDIDLKGRGQEASTSFRFGSPMDGRHIQFRVRVRIPVGWAADPSSAIQIGARDTRNRWQYTDRTKGRIDPGNPMVAREGQSYVLNIVYRPTPMTYAMEGSTPIGFNPDWSTGGGIQEISLAFTTSDKASPDTRLIGRAEILEQRIEAAESDVRPEHAHVTPVMRRVRNPASFVQPISTHQLGSGASRYFNYGDIGPKYDGTAVDAYFASLEKSQHRYFRLMPVFRIGEGFVVGDAEFSAMDRLVASARDHHITLIVTLFDAAVENPKLREIMQSDAQLQTVLEKLRPFIRRYRSDIQSARVIISAVNEIQDFRGTTARQKQKLIEEIDRLVIEEAPGATIIVGDVVRLDDLAYYLYIPELFKGRPAKFIVAMHLWGPDEFLPDADRLNLPDSGNIIGVWITEHGAKHGYDWVPLIAHKGYQVALVWTDAEFPYDPALHRAALGPPMPAP
jgi:hypothetical protein